MRSGSRPKEACIENRVVMMWIVGKEVNGLSVIKNVFYVMMWRLLRAGPVVTPSRSDFMFVVNAVESISSGYCRYVEEAQLSICVGTAQAPTPTLPVQAAAWKNQSHRCHYQMEASPLLCFRCKTLS